MYLGGAGLALAVFVALLCAVVAGGGDPLPGDAALHRWVVRVRATPWVGLARGVTTLGGSAVAAGFAFVIVVVLAVLGRVRPVVAALVPVVMATSVFVRTLICDAVGRPRPPSADWVTTPGGRAFPSGHTANATVAFGLIALIVWGVVGAGSGREGVRRAVAAGCAAAALAVGCSRVWLGVHWPTDVLGGWAYGTSVLMLVAATGMLGPSTAGSGSGASVGGRGAPAAETAPTDEENDGRDRAGSSRPDRVERLGPAHRSDGHPAHRGGGTSSPPGR